MNGSPVYQLCVYDEVGGSPTLAISASVSAGGTCGTKPCWKSLKGKGFKYKNKSTNADGIFQMLLKAGEAGKGSIKIKGKGGNLPLPGPVGAEYFAQDVTVRVQLRQSPDETCWESAFPASTTKKNVADQFKAVAK